MSGSAHYAVLLRKDVKLEVPKVSGPLADCLQINIYDAKRLVRYARGIFLDSLEQARAEAVVAALAKLGVETLVADEAEFISFARPRRVVIADCSEAGFKVKSDFRREYELIPWERVEYACAGIIATDQYRNYLSSKSFKLLPAIHRIEDEDAKRELREKLANQAMKKTKVPGGTEIRQKNKMKEDDIETLKGDQTLGYLDLLIAPQREHLRISRHDFRFDYLGARARPRSFDNFKLLAQDIVSFSREALVSSITMALLDGLEVHELVFDTPKEFDRYNTWFAYMGQASSAALRSTPAAGAAGGATGAPAAPTEAAAGQPPTASPPPAPPAASPPAGESPGTGAPPQPPMPGH
ncbi:MAG: hypothetical protein HYZ53_07085 [Planctomycetes bacterium]|nr:hypothetical protein [Planctomycetota bacterium]